MKKITKKTLFALFVCIILLTSAAFVSSATEVNTEPKKPMSFKDLLGF